MIMLQKRPSGKWCAIASGRVNQDAKYFPANDNHSTKFSITVECVNREYKHINCQCWGKIAKYAAGIEKGDYVQVCGMYERDDYYSEKQGKDCYYIVCDFVQVMPYTDNTVQQEGD